MMPSLALLISILGAVGFAARHKGPERKLEKGVQRHPAGVDGGHAGGRRNHQTLGTAFSQVVEKRRLAGAGLAGEKNMAAGIVNEFIGQLEFRVGLVHG
jgi:hypothetical protein